MNLFTNQGAAQSSSEDLFTNKVASAHMLPFIRTNFGRMEQSRPRLTGDSYVGLLRGTLTWDSYVGLLRVFLQGRHLNMKRSADFKAAQGVSTIGLEDSQFRKDFKIYFVIRNEREF